MREQQAVHTLRAHRPETQTQGTSRHSVGTSSGIHPEDRPRLTDTRRPTNKQPIYEEEEDDDLYPTRRPSSARRYASVPATTPPRTVMRVTRHQGPPSVQQRAQAPKGRVHFLLYVGIAMVCMVVGWIVLSSLGQWWQVQRDTWQYGTPRTFQIDANVNHGGISHFTVENLGGHILIYEVVLSDLSHPHLYLGPILSGAGTGNQPATISFEDINGDGSPDLIIAVGTGRYPLINDHETFRQVTSSDHLLSGKGV